MFCLLIGFPAFVKSLLEQNICFPFELVYLIAKLLNAHRKISELEIQECVMWPVQVTQLSPHLEKSPLLTVWSLFFQNLLEIFKWHSFGLKNFGRFIHGFSILKGVFLIPPLLSLSFI